MAEQRGIIGRAWTVGRVAGIDLRIDISWLAIAALVVWSFWSRFESVHEMATGTALAMAVVGAILFFSSVLAHELAHALEATHRGVTIAGITLFLFGGVTESKFDVKRPRDEFALTAVGPFTSLVLAAAFGLLATATDAVQTVAVVAGMLGWINLALGLFNLLPGAPLDGGRILRSAVWWVTGDRLKSIRWAAGAGYGVGALIMGLGVLQLFAPGGFVGGLWFLFIGWFLIQGAGAEYQQAQVRRALEGVAVEQLIDRSIPRIPAEATVQEAVDRWLRVTDADPLPVQADGEIVGVIGVDEVRGLDRGERAERSVREVMVPIDDLPAVASDDQAPEVLDELIGPGRAVVAREDGHVDGLVTARRLALVARRSLELAERRRGRGTRRSRRAPDGGDGGRTDAERPSEPSGHSAA